MERQALGIVRPFEVLQTQKIFTESRLDYIKAVATYNKSQYAVMLTFAYLFKSAFKEELLTNQFSKEF